MLKPVLNLNKLLFLSTCLSILIWSLTPIATKADCCVCTHPDVNGKFCINYPANFDCSTLKNNTDPGLKVSTCTKATQCSQASQGNASGLCINSPVDSNAFSFANLPKKPGASNATKGSAATGSPAPILNIPIPGVNLSPAYQDQSVAYIPFLAEYIVAVQKILIGLATIAAAIMIIYGGVMYIISGTGAHIRDSKEIIKDALIGMVLILGSYVILANLNPNLTTLPSLMVPIVKSEPFSFSTGYADGGEALDLNCSEECPAMKHPEAKGSGSRMKAACKGGGTKEALKAVLEVWAKEARPYGSAYVRGGTGYGSTIKVATPYTGHLFCLLGAKGWISNATKQACGLPEDFSFDSTPGKGSCSSSESINLRHKDLKDAQLLAQAQASKNKGPCYESLKRDFSAVYVCPIKCNDLFGADCSGFVGLALGCAGIKHSAAVVYKVQGQANAEFNNKDNPIRSIVGVTVCKNAKTKQYLSCRDDLCNPASSSYDEKACVKEKLPGYTAFSLSKEEFISNILPSLPFGSTIEYMCQNAPIPHMFLYTGKMRLPFETIESGGAGGDPNQGTATFLNWHGQSEFTAGRGIQVKPSMSAYISGLCGGNGVKYIYAMNDL